MPPVHPPILHSFLLMESLFLSIIDRIPATAWHCGVLFSYATTNSRQYAVLIKTAILPYPKNWGGTQSCTLSTSNTHSYPALHLYPSLPTSHPLPSSLQHTHSKIFLHLALFFFLGKIQISRNEKTTCANTYHTHLRRSLDITSLPRVALHHAPHPPHTTALKPPHNSLFNWDHFLDNNYNKHLDTYALDLLEGKRSRKASGF